MSQAWLRWGRFDPVGVFDLSGAPASSPATAVLHQRPGSLAWLGISQPDARALQGDATLIDPTSHVEAVVNFLTICV